MIKYAICLKETGKVIGGLGLHKKGEVYFASIWLSKEYHNLDSELVFKCNEGHEVYASWKRMRNKLECPVCKTNVYKD